MQIQAQNGFRDDHGKFGPLQNGWSWYAGI
jgi:hypothetical protein